MTDAPPAWATTLLAEQRALARRFDRLDALDTDDTTTTERNDR